MHTYFVNILKYLNHFHKVTILNGPIKAYISFCKIEFLSVFGEIYLHQRHEIQSYLFKMAYNNLRERLFIEVLPAKQPDSEERKQELDL